MQKLQRNYRIEFEIGTKGKTDEQGNKKDLTTYIPSQTLTVSYPISLQLNINQNVFSSANSGKFILYNLNPNTRALLYKDKYDLTKYVTMKLYAGYQNTMPLVFYGDFLQCYSYRKSGSVDWITEIEATDMMYIFQYGFANYTMAAGTTFENLLKTLLADIPNLEIGYISPKIQPLKKSQTFWGETLSILKNDYLDYQIYVHNNELNVIAEDETVPGQISLITPKSGLLGSPTRAEMYLDVECIFEPGILPGQGIALESTTLSYLNNIYKVIGLQHRGIISAVQSGALTTQLTLSLGSTFYQELKKLSGTYETQPVAGKWIKPTKTGYITSPFGKRIAPKTQNGYGSVNHEGIDIGVKVDTPVYAINAGTVTFAGSAGGYGNFLTINHGKIDGVQVTSHYAHLHQFTCSINQSVGQGEQIALSGGAIGLAGAGNSGGAHLHFEIKENGKPVNPIKYIGSY